MDAPTPDVALWLDVYDRLMAAYYAGPASGVVTATDPVDAILTMALKFRDLIGNRLIGASA